MRFTEVKPTYSILVLKGVKLLESIKLNISFEVNIYILILLK